MLRNEFPYLIMLEFNDAASQFASRHTIYLQSSKIRNYYFILDFD